ncbi:response regulator transcription factor [Sporosalibacterium faouarense]|uniref:response regulator transcription factor n=1 Tax=Sporosalibacterium faouarense TaxID=516123 RepID=UPI00192BC2B9|nr:response regulator transcription factor [Sporosalibacterium faouarense]
MNILIVEDDISLNNGIVLSLKQDNYEFTQSFTIKDAKKHLSYTEFDLIILDVKLPDGNGFDLCRQIRQASDTPIIFLTANDMEIDEVTGLELGGDDYITKPFSLMILRARVSRLLRRVKLESIDEEIIIGDFLFNFNDMRFYKKGNKVELSKTEQKLLKILIKNKGNVVKRTTLIDKIWAEESDYVDENALSVTIKRLRDKLEDNPVKPKYIQTVYGIGYIWKVEKNE